MCAQRAKWGNRFYKEEKMIKSISTAVMLSVAAICGMAAVPNWWYRNYETAKAQAAELNKPVLIIFAGENKSSDEFIAKMTGSDQIISAMRNGCVTAYIKLPAATTWKRNYLNRMKERFPFLELESGVPLPAMYFVTPDGKDLKIAEPALNAASFRKAVKQSAAALAVHNNSNKRPAAAVSNAMPDKEDKVVRKSSARKKQIKPDSNNSGDDEKYSANSQKAEAARQRKANSDPKGDPPAGWFIDPEKAKEFAAKRGLPIMWLFSGTDWCGPCKGLRRNVLDKKEVEKLVVKECVAVYIHVPAGGWGMIRQKYPFWRSRGVPSFVFTDAEVKKVKSDIRVKRSYQGLKQAIKTAAKSLK